MYLHRGRTAHDTWYMMICPALVPLGICRCGGILIPPHIHCPSIKEQQQQHVQQKNNDHHGPLDLISSSHGAGAICFQAHTSAASKPVNSFWLVHFVLCIPSTGPHEPGAAAEVRLSCGNGGGEIKDMLEKLKRSAMNRRMGKYRDLKVLRLKRSWRQGNMKRGRWWMTCNNLARNLWLCVYRWWRGLSVFRCSRADEQPVTADTKRPEPAFTAGYWTSLMMGEEKVVFLSAKSGVKMAKGEDESASRVQTSFVSRWWKIKGMQSGLCTLRTEDWAVSHGKKRWGITV